MRRSSGGLVLGLMLAAPVAAAQEARGAADEQAPLHLGRFLQVEADRARTERIGSAALAMVGGAVDVGLGIGTFVYSNANEGGLASSDQALGTIITVLPIILGGTVMLGGVFTLLTPSPMERLLDVYAPIALDKSLSPAERVSRGEGLLRGAAEADHGRRVTEAVGAFVAAAIGIGFGIGFGADSGDFPAPTNLLLASSLVGLGVVEIVAGVGALWWERGVAEVAWEQWHASHEPVVVQTSRVQLRPLFAPTVGGATGGLLVRF